MPSSLAASWMFVSGAAALLYEVLWVRDLGYTFGGSAQALSAVVAAFLAGLALGAWWAGRRVAPRPGLLRVYAALELTIALYAPLAPWLIGALDRTLLAAWWPALADRGLATAARFLVTFVLLLPATACMGATLPVLCTAFASARERTGALIGRLYGWNTLGGVVGCLLAGFVLVEHVGLWRSRVVAALLNLALAFVAWRRGARELQLAPSSAAAAPDAAPARAGGSAAPSLAAPAWAAALVATSALSIALEFGWTRLLALAVGGTTYSFSIVLALYLAGLGGGALLYAAHARRGKSPLAAVILAQLLLGALLMALQPRLDDLSAWVGSELWDATSAGGVSPHAARARLALAMGGIVVLLPALLLGIAFPALSDLRVATRGEIGRGIGSAYLLSTSGGVAASLLTHFWLLPRFGLEGTLLLLAAGCGGVGALLLVAVAARAPRVGVGVGFGSALLVLFAVTAAALARVARWDARTVYGGIGLYGPRALGAERQLLEVRDGASCSVAVFQNRSEISLSVNGKVDATSRGDMRTQLLLAWLPQLLARESREVFVLGYGAGVTAGAAARYGGRVTCAEIEEEVVAASPHFAAVNGAAHDDPRIAIVADDGRAVLRRARERFDVITTEPSNPWLAGMAALFTVEFYELCRDRLADGGVLCQWVQLYWSSPDDYQAIFATLGSVFPHVAIWKTTSGDTLMLGAMSPLALDPAELDRRAKERPWLPLLLAQSGGSLVEAPLASQLARIALLAGEDARAFADAGPRRIRDDVPFLEFSAARNMQASSGDAILARVFAARRVALYQQEALVAGLPAVEVAPLLRDVAEQLLAHGSAELAESLLADAHARAPGLDRLRYWRWLAAKRRGDAAEAARRLAELELRAPALLTLVAEEHSFGGAHEEALAALDRAERTCGATAEIEYQRGRVLERMGRRSDAIVRYERALKLDRQMGAASDALRRMRDAR